MTVKIDIVAHTVADVSWLNIPVNYRRDWLIGACAYRLQQKEICTYYMYALISSYQYVDNIIRTRAIFQIQIMGSLKMLYT